MSRVLGVCAQVIMLAGVLGLSSLTCFYAQADRLETDARGVPLAAPEATVDRVAYSYQRNAIERMEQLLASGKMAAQEGQMLDRLARLQWEHAEITFRVAHAEAYEKKKAIALTGYHQALGHLVATVTRLIDRHGKTPYAPDAYLLRAKAFAELGDKQKSFNDYKYLVDTYRDVPIATSAYVALGEHSFSSQQFAQAIQYFQLVLKKKGAAEVSFAFRRLAWSYYNLGDLKSAFVYLKQYLKSQEAKGSESEAFEDVAAFFVKGLETGAAEFQISQAIPMFTQTAAELHASEESVDVAIVQLTKLLRAKNRPEIEAWRKLVVARRPIRPSTQDALAIIHENYLNLSRYEEAVRSAQEIASLGKTDRAKATLLGTVARFQEAIRASKSDEVRTKVLSALLARVYAIYLDTAPGVTADVIQTEYNLAETYASLAEHAKAHEMYLKILAQARAQPALVLQAKLKPEDIAFKAVATQYESLKRRKVFPETIRAAEPAGHSPKPLDPEFARWLALLKNTETDRRTAFYQYERIRARYAAGFVRESLEDLLWFVREYQDSPYAIPSGELALDTLVLSKDWKRVLEVAAELKAYRLKDDAKFRSRVAELSGDATYKLAEAGFNSGQGDAVLANADRTLASLGAQPARKADFLMIQAKAAVLAKQDAVTVGATNELIKMPDSVSGKYKPDAFLMRAAVWERGIELKAAMSDYRQFFRVAPTHPSRTIVAKKLLLYSWILGDQRELAGLVRDPSLCRTLASDCARYSALLGTLDTPSTRDAGLKSRIAQGAKSDPFLALLALEQERSMKVTDRLERVRLIAEKLRTLDPLVQFAVMDRVAKVVPSVFSLSRSETARMFPVKADQPSVERRLKMVRFVESVGTRVLELPWARVRAEVLSEVGALYGDLGSDIRGIPAPRGLAGEDLTTFRSTMEQIAAPYLASAKEFQAKAFELASHSGIEDQSYRVILGRLKAVEPEFAAESVARRGLASATALPAELERRVVVDPLEAKKPFGKLVAKWREGFARRNFALMAYLIQIAPGTPGFSEPVVRQMRGASLALAGAQSEALAEIEKETPEAK